MMWVGGAGVSRGYINLPELTSRRYKLNKFLQDGYVHAFCLYYGSLIRPRSMMFNTGDVVRWREDGSLEIFGRKDDQVKIKVRLFMP
jgi:non-ribosomal peptide synthetase component F